MASHKSAEKRIRADKVRRERNKANRSRIRTEVKKFRELVTEGQTGEAQKALPALMSDVQGSVKKRVMSKKTAARRLSRLSRALHRAAKA